MACTGDGTGKYRVLVERPVRKRMLLRPQHR